MTKEIPRVAKNPADALLYHLMLQMAVTHILHRAKPVLVKDEDIGAILGKIIDRYAVERNAYVIEDERERDPDARLQEGKIVKSFADFATDETIKKVAEELHLKLTAHTDVKNISIEDVEYALKKARDLAKKIVREHLDNNVMPDYLKKNPFIALALHDEEIIKFLAGFREDESPLVNEPKAQKENTENAPSGTKLEILSILNGLEFAGFTEEAKRKAVEKLSARIEELLEKELTPENLQRLGLYAFAVEMIKRGDFERLREIEKL